MLRLFAACLLTTSLAMDLEEKVEKLHTMTSKTGIIKLDTAKFDTYVRGRPRDYSFIVMTTALKANRGCQVCGEAYEEYKILYNSYRQNNHADFTENKVFFGLVDYDDAPEVFQQLKLNSAPGFFHFPAHSQKTSKDDKLDLARKGYQADQLAKWVSERTPIKINVVRPPSYAGLMIIVGIAVLCLTLAYATGFNFEWLMQGKLWAVISIFIVLLMTSGQMWNHIRGPPPMGRNGNRMQFIASGSQMQYVFETYWVFVMYGLCSYGVILLADKAGDKGLEGGKRRFFGFLGLALFVLFYSLILATFRGKYQGYPYKLLF